MGKLNFCIVIPIFNEEEIVLDIINKALIFAKGYKSKIILINDGSNDSTKKILSKIKNKRIIIIHKNNEGHGKTLIKGYKKAIKLKPDFVLQIDSDDQISFNEFRKLYKFKYQFDFIVGNRKNRDDPFSRIFITFALKAIILVLFGRHVEDPNCPLRVIKTSFLNKIINSVSYSNIPNILVSIYAKEKKVYKSVNIKHKQRYTGSGIKYFKLLKLCIFSLMDIFKFKFL